MRPPRNLLTTIEAVSIPFRQSIAGARAREAHGIQSNSHHVPSSRRARYLAESAFQLIFREGSRSGFPGVGKGLMFEKSPLSQKEGQGGRAGLLGIL